MKSWTLVPSSQAFLKPHICSILIIINTKSIINEFMNNIAI